MRKRHLLIPCICFLVLTLLLFGCHKASSNPEATIDAVSGDEVNLSDGMVINMVLSSETDDAQCIAAHLVTNSKEITVSCASIPDDAEILLTLYDESRTDPLFSTSLSSDELSTVFRPLTSVKLYQLTAVVENCPSGNELSITITD